MSKFLLSCESTVDMPFGEIAGRDIGVLFYKYTVGETEYEDDMGRTPGAREKLYEILAGTALPRTSRINTQTYIEFLEPRLQRGDVMHIVFGSGMTGSYECARAAAEELKGKYPGRRLEVIDSVCSSSGYGLLVSAAADLRDSGAEPEEVRKRIEYLRTRVHHQFFSTCLDYYRRSGRMSGPAAAIGTLLNICPLMRLNREGKIIAYSKVHGIKNAVDATVKEALAHAQNGSEYEGKMYICHSDCPDKAEKLRAELLRGFPGLKDIPIYDIGSIIASHCGPGTVAVFFIGDERPE